MHVSVRYEMAKLPYVYADWTAEGFAQHLMMVYCGMNEPDAFDELFIGRGWQMDSESWPLRFSRMREGAELIQRAAMTDGVSLPFEKTPDTGWELSPDFTERRNALRGAIASWRTALALRDSKPDDGDFRRLVAAGMRELGANKEVVNDLFQAVYNHEARKRAKTKNESGEIPARTIGSIAIGMSSYRS